ncbi:hypothetical protein DPEC_G00242160 [Dallia pectoralis]|uniref:Uncharacterized protein n=1 Tax=Dallia pectoralis TaxID=75939 RepID=A0ACC2FV77_DALPE|nr:hypothetical protein DPEC_G00242160 [Dallia pectoralis]
MSQSYSVIQCSAVSLMISPNSIGLSRHCFGAISTDVLTLDYIDTGRFCPIHIFSSTSKNSRTSVVMSHSRSY